ncbi:MAG: S24 family peptidase [Sutterellaceae bacterium]|nr:S24 family peptidase [Sutterellaceae bacterium]
MEIEVSSFSPRLARQIASYNLGPNAPAHVNNGMAIPLVSFDQVSQVSDGEKLQEMLGNASVDEHLLVDATLPENCFAMCIEDHSMQPEFLKGDFIIVDPMLRPLPGDFVVANIANSVSCMIRKYRQIGFDDHGNESFELMPLNNDFASAYSDKQTCRIVGVVIEHRRKYRNK